MSEELRRYRARQADAARYQGQANASRANRASAARLQGQADAFAKKQAGQSSWERALNTGMGTFVPESRKPKPPAPPSYVPDGDEDGFTTDPSNTPEPDPYPTVLPSLSAEQLGALSERRRLADKRYKQAETESAKRKELLEASANRARTSAERESKRSIEDFMREAAGKGVARSPMVAGREIRRTGEDLRLTYGEIDTKLSTEISALQDMVAQAELARSEEIAAISQEEVNMRADLKRMFPAAETYV